MDGKPEWQPFTWFVQRPRRPFSVSLPEIALLFTKPHEWWRRIKWWYAMYGVSRFLEDDTAVDRWAGPERKAEIDLLVRPFLCRAISSAYAAANQDHEGLQRMFREYDVEMQRTQAIPADLPLDVLLEEHGKSVAARRRAIFDDLGT
ncbi:hypothetical protein HYS28_03740 [Candidatus Uhrbacteria bacterium]|nr:hypothetical protein [Candidatus Uhrbacteria bacterium]